MKKVLIFTLSVFIYSCLAHADLMKDFDSLGGNDVLLERARILSPDTEIRVVQDRIVPRHSRHEFNIGYSNFIGGDAYLNTQTLGFDYHFHVTPRWSFSGRYFSAFNGLSTEGDSLINGTIKDRLKPEEQIIPDLDAPQSGYMATVNWYPFYGKLNMFDFGIVHFDAYFLGGYGQIKLQSGDKGTYAVGAGLGFWISQHLTSRLEIRYQSYEAQRFTGVQDMGVTIATFSMGYML